MANLYREAQAERHTSLSLVVRHIWASGRQWAILARSLWWHRGASLLELEVRTKPSSLAGSRHSKNARRGGVKWGVWEDRVGQGLCTDGQLISDFRKGKGVLWFPLPPPTPAPQQWGLNLLPCSSGWEVYHWATHLERVYSLSYCKHSKSSPVPEMSNCLARCNQGVIPGRMIAILPPEAATWNSRSEESWLLKLQARNHMRAEASILAGQHGASIRPLLGTVMRRMLPQCTKLRSLVKRT